MPVLVPRRAVFTLRADMPVERARAALAGSGHSRAPVGREGYLDDVVGVANLRDLLTTGGFPTRPGEHVTVAPWAFEVADTQHNTITAVRLRPVSGPVSAGGRTA